MKAIEIRLARIGDAEAVEDYHHRCFVKTYKAQLDAGDFRTPERPGTLHQLREWFAGSEFVTYVAVVDDQPIGHYTVMRHHLVHLFVEPEYQGRGLGRRLLARAEAAIRANGHDEYELHTRVENLSAIGFYKAFGWVMTDRLIRTVEHGISYDEHVMTKRD